MIYLETQFAINYFLIKKEKMHVSPNREGKFMGDLIDHDITLGAKEAVKINITCSYQ